MICRCVGDPVPDIKWYHGKEETELLNGGRYKVSIENDQQIYYIVKLEITNVITGDRGEYRAIASNLHGSGVATIYLNFEGGNKPKSVNVYSSFKSLIRNKKKTIQIEGVKEED